LLTDATSHTNTATAEQQNYDYDKAGVGVESGTTDAEGTAPVNFAGADVNEVDACITVDDTNPNGPQGEVVCVGDPPEAFHFHYSVNVGPYSDAECGLQTTIDNTASFVTDDTGATDQDSWTVNVNVVCTCTLTQGYWKTHNDSFKGGAPTDAGWALIGASKEQTGFFTNSGPTYFSAGPNGPSFTWSKVFWTAPKGNVYYNLAHQYMAAKLNIRSGAASNAAVNAAISFAEGRFALITPTVAATYKGPAKLLWTAAAGVLGSYNEGLIGPGHCSEQNP
jgi:hypothetical protein